MNHVTSQSLLNQVILSDPMTLDAITLEVFCRNPFLIRSFFPIKSVTMYGKTYTLKSQSLLNQVILSDSYGH